MEIETRFPRVLAAAKIVRHCQKRGGDHALAVAVAAFDREVEAAMWVKREVGQTAPPAHEDRGFIVRNTRELLDALQIDDLTPGGVTATAEQVRVFTQTEEVHEHEIHSNDLTIVADDDQEPREDDAGEPDSVILARAGVVHVHATD